MPPHCAVPHQVGGRRPPRCTRRPRSGIASASHTLRNPGSCTHLHFLHLHFHLHLHLHFHRHCIPTAQEVASLQWPAGATQTPKQESKQLSNAPETAQHCSQGTWLQPQPWRQKPRLLAIQGAAILGPNVPRVIVGSTALQYTILSATPASIHMPWHALCPFPATQLTGLPAAAGTESTHTTAAVQHSAAEQRPGQHSSTTPAPVHQATSRIHLCLTALATPTHPHST